MTMPSDDRRDEVTPLGEVIETSTRHVVAEVHRGQDVPSFGSWVEIEHADGTMLYGLISHVETGSIEPGRRATALGLRRDDLLREMPQIAELVRTAFRAQLLAYRDDRGRLHQTLPPRPAALHEMVRPCSDETVCALARPFDYLRTLSTSPDAGGVVDDLLVAVLRQLYRANGGGETGEQAVLDAGRALSRLMNADHERLQSILRRVT
jgi:hypothetical protein